MLLFASSRTMFQHGIAIPSDSFILVLQQQAVSFCINGMKSSYSPNFVVTEQQQQQQQQL
jgi:hypothetical protein